MADGGMWENIFAVLKGVVGGPLLVLLAFIGVAASVIWVVYVFFSEGTRYSAQKYYDLKYQLSVEAAKSVAQMASSSHAATIRAAAIRFDELYWGELVLVEDITLEGAMVEFRELIANPDSNELEIEKLIAMQIDRTKLRTYALRVSRAGFNLLQPNWFDQLKSTFRKAQKQ
jgi:hypothetical protein